MMIERHQFLNEDVIINSFDYLLDEETNYPIEQFPIIEHRGKMIISLDLLEEYAYNNDIDNLGVLIEQVCYSSNIHPSNITLSIRDENLYSNRYNVDMVATLLDENVDIMLDHSWEMLNESDDKKWHAVEKVYSNSDKPDRIGLTRSIEDDEDGKISVTHIRERNKDFVDTVKELEYKGMFWPRKKLAQLLAWFHRISYEFNAKIKRDPDHASWWRKLLGYATRAIEWITKRLHNLVSDSDNQLGDDADSSNLKKWYHDRNTYKTANINVHNKNSSADFDFENEKMTLKSPKNGSRSVHMSRQEMEDMFKKHHGELDLIFDKGI